MASLSSQLTVSIFKDFMAKINGRHSMTAKDLMAIDDICTTLIVDPLLRFKSHKLLQNYQSPTMKTHLISLSIMLQFIADGDVLKVYQNIHSLKVVRDFLRHSDMVFRHHFRDHLLRFIAMFRFDSGYTISSCSRYRHENYVGAKLISTKYWQKGDTIEMLIGVIANLNEDEESELLVNNKNDFSVLMSQRKKKPQLWLGPGAFLNHNCEPNCQFSLNKNKTAKIMVLHDIKPGEELFISYGPEFFGDNNCECECQSCEKNGIGYFRVQASQRLRKFAASPPSLIYTRNENGELIRKRSRSIIVKTESIPKKVCFDSKKFLQDHINQRFINLPLLSGIENIRKIRYPILETLKFRKTGSLVALANTENPSTLFNANDFTGWDCEFKKRQFNLEKLLPKPPRTLKQLKASNYFTVLCFNLEIAKKSKKKIKKRVAKKSRVNLKSCKIPKTNSKKPHVTYKKRLQSRQPDKKNLSNAATGVILTRRLTSLRRSLRNVRKASDQPPMKLPKRI